MMLLSSVSFIRDFLRSSDSAGGGAAVIDDEAFALHYRVTANMLFFMSVLVTGAIFFGDPIHCTPGMSEPDKMFPSNMLNVFCFIHSTFLVPSAGTSTRREQLIPYPGVGHYSPEDESTAQFQSYYQWTGLIFLMQGLAFMVPRIVWRQAEGSTMRSLRLNLGAPGSGSVLVGSKGSDDRELDLLSGCLLGRSQGVASSYGRNYILCSSLNLVNVLAQVGFCNVLLNGNFLSYGWKFSYEGVHYGNSPKAEDVVFPKMSKCSVYTYGPSGSVQNFDALCILPLNLLHDKIFLILWFWYLILTVLTMAWLAYLLILSASRSARSRCLERLVLGGGGGDEVQRPSLHRLTKRFSDFFVLRQLHKNIHYSNFCELIWRLQKGHQRPGQATPLIKPFQDNKGSEDQLSLTTPSSP